MENFQTYPERCNNLKIKPLPEVLTVLAEESQSLSIQSKQLTDPDFSAISSVLRQNLPYLQDLSLSNQNFSHKSLTLLSDSIQSSKYITKISITKSLFTLESCKSLTNAIQVSSILEYLDLSENSMTDLYADSLYCLFNSNIKILIFDKNNFQNCSFANVLGNSCLLQFSICDNPLNYKSVLKLLESVSDNRVLSRLSLLGIQFKGAAPIKENTSGLLDAQEGLILKLAYVLRGSLLNYIAVDITPLYELQLKELENTLIKHNKSLCSIDSRLIDWNNLPTESPLINIQLALKANKWLNSSNSGQIPPDIREIVKIKENYSLHTEESRPRSSSKNSVVNFTETSEDLNSIHSSPQFAGKETKKKLRKNPGKQIFQYLEKIVAKVNELDGRIMRKLETFENKIDELELREQKKDQQLADLNKKMENFNGRLSLIESKFVPQNLADNSIKTLESLKFAINPSSTKVATIENSVKKLFSKIRNIEENTKEPIEKTLISKFASFEDRLNQIEKVSSSVNKKNAREVAKRQKRPERGTSAQNHGYASPDQTRSGFKAGAEYESVLMGALMERVNFSLKNSPERPMSAMSLHNSYTRAPSSDLQESLRKRGLILNNKY